MARRSLRWAALTYALLAMPFCASAQSDDFFKGKSINFVVGYGAGSGYDLYARLLARYYGNFIPGHPNIVTQNVPGAGSLQAANQLYETAPRDGTVIGMTGRGTPMTPLLGGKGARFKDDKSFSWIGSMNNEVSVCVAWHTSGIASIQDAMVRELTTSATAVGADDTTVFPAVLNAMIGTKFRWITGYPGGAAMNLAMEREEVQGRCGWSWSSIKSMQAQWLKEGKIRILLQLSVTPHPDLANVPTIMDFAKSDEQRKVLELIFARQIMGRPVLAPPNLPPERLKILRDAFDATLKDKAFLAEAEKADWEITPVSGPEIEKLMARIYATPPAIVELAQKVTPQPK
jgi:tripartite-type tricarboxylate transporter receptor subunit TctC